MLSPSIVSLSSPPLLFQSPNNAWLFFESARKRSEDCCRRHSAVPDIYAVLFCLPRADKNPVKADKAVLLPVSRLSRRCFVPSRGQGHDYSAAFSSHHIQGSQILHQANNVSWARRRDPSGDKPASLSHSFHRPRGPSSCTSHLSPPFLSSCARPSRAL